MTRIVTACSRASLMISGWIGVIEGQKKQTQADYTPRRRDFMDLIPGRTVASRGSSCAGFDGQAI